jgi:hypothetical protein
VPAVQSSIRRRHLVADGSTPYFVDISAGQWHSLALADDGSVYAWGENRLGQLGDGTTNPQSAFGHATPVIGLPPDDPVRWIGSYDDTSIAITESGAYYRWGVADTVQPTPQLVSTFSTPIVKLDGNLLIDADGQLWEVWLDQVAPVPVQLPATPVDVAGCRFLCSTALAVTDDGHVYGWNNSLFGNLTYAVPPGFLLTPVNLGFHNATAVSAGFVFSVVVGHHAGSPLDLIELAAGHSGVVSSVTTDTEGDGATFTDPIETTVTLPAGLLTMVHITETPLVPGAPATGFVMHGWQSSISASAEADPANPYIVQFDIQLPLSALPPEASPAETAAFVAAISVLRDGASVPDCDGASPPYGTYPGHPSLEPPQHVETPI